MDESNKERLDDFSSLFLPDLLHPVFSNSSQRDSIKEEEIDQSVQELLGRGDGNQSGAFGSLATNVAPTSHISHYANLIPIEASSIHPHHFQHHPYAVNSHNGDLSGNSMLETFMMNNMLEKSSTPDLNQLMSAQVPGHGGVLMSSNINGGVFPATSQVSTQVIPPPKKKAKKKKPKAAEFQIDYKPSKLTRLLDFKCSLNNYPRIIDKDNNEIKVKFNGFLNGRFFTNDVDNNNFLLSNNEVVKPLTKKDPKVISCYRRNYIQLVLNMNLSGFRSDNKILKLQSSEYGYTITRIIKWFKIEIFANTNISNSTSVPIIIKDENKDKDSKSEIKEDSIKLSPINSEEHIITLNNSIIKNNEIDNFFVIKKLQFKNATPNNGNLTFQNYYHLKIRLKATIADLYFDDYMDEDFSATNHQDNNEITLLELTTEPIIVRGRNPNFYTERKDLLIKGRSSLSKESFLDIERVEDQDEGIADQQVELNLGLEGDLVGEEEEDEVEVEEEHQLMNLQIDGQLKKMKSSNQPEIYQNLEESEDASSDDDSYQSQHQNQKSEQSMASSNTSSIEFKNLKGYNYFPISSVYYLPPINVVYFPHGAHHQQQQILSQKMQQDTNSKADSSDEDVLSQRRRSNVYFKS